MLVVHGSWKRPQNAQPMRLERIGPSSPFNGIFIRKTLVLCTLHTDAVDEKCAKTFYGQNCGC